MQYKLFLSIGKISVGSAFIVGGSLGIFFDIFLKISQGIDISMSSAIFCGSCALGSALLRSGFMDIREI